MSYAKNDDKFHKNSNEHTLCPYLKTAKYDVAMDVYPDNSCVAGTLEQEATWAAGKSKYEAFDKMLDMFFL